MTGIELTERLINDIEKAIKSKSIARSYDQYRSDMAKSANNPEFELNHSIDELLIGQNCDISIPYKLSDPDFIAIINTYGSVLDVLPNTRFDLKEFLKQLNSVKIVLAGNIEKIRNNVSLVFLHSGGSEPLFNVLVEKLNYIHNEAIVAYNCYETLSLEQKQPVV